MFVPFPVSSITILVRLLLSLLPKLSFLVRLPFRSVILVVRIKISPVSGVVWVVNFVLNRIVVVTVENVVISVSLVWHASVEGGTHCHTPTAVSYSSYHFLLYRAWCLFFSTHHPHTPPYASRATKPFVCFCVLHRKSFLFFAAARAQPFALRVFHRHCAARV